MDLVKIKNKSGSKTPTNKPNKKYVTETPSTISKDNALVRIKLKKLLDEGRTEITSDQLNEYPTGSIISYTNGKSFFLGGTLTWIGEKSFVYRKLDIDPNVKYRVSFKNVEKIYIINSPIIPTTHKVTKYPIKFGSTIVHYCADSFDVKRFMNTDKYLFMKTWFDVYH
jgi:hypothetical protein